MYTSDVTELTGRDEKGDLKTRENETAHSARSLCWNFSR